MQKVVIDTNVILSALKSKRGASYKLLSLLPSEHFKMVLSVPLYTEYQDVTTRPAHMTGTSNPDQIIAFTRYLCSIAEHQKIFFLWRPWLKDPKDDMVLELAVASDSQYIITYNIKDFRNISSFGIKTITPADFLKEMKGQKL